MMGRKTVRDANVKDVEKRRYPSKHYVYVLEVNWSEGSSTTVFRRYSDFFEFQCGLLEKFPLEGGLKDPTQRMIPFLPGKKLLSRSQTRAVAEKRKEKINDYCRTLIRLPPNISDCDFVLEFFEVWQSDLEKPKKPKPVKGQPKINEISDPLILERYVAIADYEKQKKNECSIIAGQTVEVIDKNSNGWWFVNVDDFHEGWVPATYLDALYGSEDISIQKLEPGEEETWISMNRYESQHHDEISFEKGVLVEVFEKGLDGWWKIRYQGKEGMGPAAYLQRYHGEGAGAASTGAELVSTLKDATDPSPSSSTSSHKPHSSATTKPSSNSHSSSVSSPSTFSSAGDTSDRSDISVDLNLSYDASNTLVAANLANTLTARVSSSQSSNHAAPTPGSKPVSVSSPQSSNHSAPTAPTRTPGPKSASVLSSNHSAPTPSPKPASSQSANHSAPAPSPKPASSVAVAAAAVAEKQKFAPTWHSKAKPHLNEEPIYGPTPRRYSFKKPPLKKREVFDCSEPVYEIIPEPETEIYVTIAEFTAVAGDGVSFDIGEECTVVTKNPGGWWYVDMDGQEGWVPSSYLERKQGTSPEPAPTSPVLPPANREHTMKKEAVKEPKKREPPKREPRKEPQRKELLKKEPLRSSSKEAPPKRPTIPSPLANMSLASKSTNSIDGEPRRPSLKRSTSTDSGINEEGGTTIPEIKVLKAPPKPSRPRNNPSLPNGVKSPRSDRKTLKGNISGPVPFQPSPIQARKSDNKIGPRKPTSPTLRPTDSTGRAMTSRGGVRSPPPKPKVGPIGRRRNSSESVKPPVRVQENTSTFNKKVSSPEINVRGASNNRRATGSSNHPTGSAYRSELEKKISKPSTLASNQQPKRPSPPNIAKTRTHSTGTKPSRPQPPKITSGPAKKPPPPKPVPFLSKKPLYITVGNYSGGNAESCLTFSEGAAVDVLEKNDDGWWFVEIERKEGWAPSTYIEENKGSKPLPPSAQSRPFRPMPFKPVSPTSEEPELEQKQEADSTPKPKPRPRPRKATTTFYRATDSYDVPTYEDSGIPITKGRVYELKEKNDSGWWLMKDGDVEGWAPSSHFEHL